MQNSYVFFLIKKRKRNKIEFIMILFFIIINLYCFVKIMDTIRLPENFHILPIELQEEIIQYLETMDNRQFKAYLIAKDHLGSSFNIFKSNGYKEWKNKKT